MNRGGKKMKKSRFHEWLEKKRLNGKDGRERR